MTNDHVAGNPSVVAIEAVPDNFRALEENISMNGAWNRMQALCTGLGECSETVDIQVEGDLKAGEGSGTANIIAKESSHACVRQKLQIEMLDVLAEQGKVPAGCSVIKIDTDGYDLNIMRGAKKFLSENRPVVFGEFSAVCMQWHGQTFRDLLVFADEAGYLVWKKGGKKSWTFTPATVADSPKKDLLLIPIEKENLFRWCLGEAR